MRRRVVPIRGLKIVRHWFFQLIGPETTLRDQKQAFEALVGSQRRGE